MVGVMSAEEQLKCTVQKKHFVSIVMHEIKNSMKKIDLLNPKNWNDPHTGKRYRYFSRNGKGYTDVLQWAREFEGPKAPKTRKDWFEKTKRVKQETTWLGFYVSTVWLGVDYSFSFGPPLIFETMVFFKSWSELDMERYTTEEQALAGHKALVKKWSNPLYVAWRFLDTHTWSIRWNIQKFLKKLS